MVCKNALASRILVVDGVATGVEYERHGVTKRALAHREVIVSAGPYQSPKLLMLSGIGPAEHLKSLGIHPIHDLAGFGENLQDQIGSFVQHACLKPITYYKYRNPLRSGLAIAEWLVLARGPLTLFPMAASGFVRTTDTVARPDVQFYIFPCAVNPHADGTFDPRQHAYNIHWGLVHLASRGRVSLASANHHAPPVIRHNYFSHETDRATNRRAFRLARDLHAQAAFDPFRGDELAPGPACQSDQEIDEHTSRYFATHYHACGTCRMGPDAMAVVDHRLRVHGVGRLRVIDSSIMPEVVTGGLNAPSMMIGEKGAAMVLEDADA